MAKIKQPTLTVVVGERICGDLNFGDACEDPRIETMNG